jgi:hypothetical protein
MLQRTQNHSASVLPSRVVVPQGRGCVSLFTSSSLLGCAGAVAGAAVTDESVTPAVAPDGCSAVYMHI